ncbi:MAG: GTP pyrophosphokinase, partial [Alistipes sp.]|nr:GTP pyrophosphokinase [Alistipes sp.]
TVLHSGDQIEIITADTARPKAEWLDVVTTAKAKQGIKSFLKREQQNNVERGHAILKEKLERFNINNPSGRVLRKIIPAYNCSNKDELYSKIGAGIIDLHDLERVIKSSSSNKILKFWTLFINKKEDKEEDDTRPIDAESGETPPAAQKTPDEFVIAECCKPIPGDSVVGFREPSSGKIIVHKSTCDELNRLAARFGKNIIKDEIKWSQHKAMSYLSNIELRGIDRMGLLLDLSQVITGDFSTNIREISILSHDGIFEGRLGVYVRDVESLNALLDKIRKIKGIESVKRKIN